MLSFSSLYGWAQDHKELWRQLCEHSQRESACKKYVFSRVCTLLSLHRKVLKIKISFQEHVQGINKRGQIHHWSVFYIPHLNEVILFSVTLVSMFVSLWKQFSDFRQSFFSDSSLLSETHTRSSLPACHFLFSEVANLGCLPKLGCLSAIVFLWR